MSLRKLQIVLLSMLCIGLCVFPVSALKVLDIDFVLAKSGAWYGTSNFDAEKYDIFHLSIFCTGNIDIQLRKSSGLAVYIWTSMTGDINLSVVIQEIGAYYLYFANIGDAPASLVGIAFLNEYILTTTSWPGLPTTKTTTTTTSDSIMFSIIPIFLSAIYGAVGVLFFISIVVYRRRRNPDFSYLAMIDDGELFPVGWKPVDEEEI